MIDSEEKFPLGVLDFYVDNKDLDNIHILKKFWNEKYWPEYEESKDLQQRIDKAIEFICKKDMEANLKGEAEFNSKELLEILRGKDENSN